MWNEWLVVVQGPLPQVAQGGDLPRSTHDTHINETCPGLYTQMRPAQVNTATHDQFMKTCPGLNEAGKWGPAKVHVRLRLYGTRTIELLRAFFWRVPVKDSPKCCIASTLQTDDYPLNPALPFTRPCLY